MFRFRTDEPARRTRRARRRPTAALAAAVALLAPIAVDSAAAGGPPGGPGGYAAPDACTRLDVTQLDVVVGASGKVRLTYPHDGHDTCNEALQVRSWGTDGVSTDDDLDPLVDESVVWVADVEAAGRGGVTTRVAMDPCFTGIEIHLDGDTLIHEEQFGTGCDLTIATDFVGAGHPTQIHVVQQTGSIEPPHIYDIADDDVTVLTGLPNGTWYVKVFSGWLPGSTIEVNGGGAQPASTVYDVADGSLVEIEIDAAFTLPLARFAVR